MSTPSRPVGLILAGGRSLRMREAFPGGQSDKGLLELSGKPLLSHVIERFAPQTSQLILNANGDPARFATFNLPVVPDSIDGFAGPLAGLLAGLHWTRANAPDTTHLVSVSTDVPFLPTNLVQRLHTALIETEAPIALARSSGGLHPVIGLWPMALADDLAAALRDGTRKVQDWTTRHAAVPVDFTDINLNGRNIDPFFNANTPRDLAQARAVLSHEHPTVIASPIPPVIGIAGWKNSGKTTLAVRLIEEFTRRGLKVASIKHTHHGLRVDDADTDSASHRRAGAWQAIVVGPHAWAIDEKLQSTPPPSLKDSLARLSPSDLILVEGYKSAAIPKIEVRRAAQADRRPLAATDPDIIAVATDHETDSGPLPVFSLDDSAAIADFIAQRLGPPPTA